MEYHRVRCMLACLLLFGLINTGYSKPSPSPAEGDYDDDVDGVYSDMQSDNDYEHVYDDNSQDPANNEAVIPAEEVEQPMTYFEVPEVNQTAKSGEDVILRCDGKNLPADPVTIWYNGTTVIVQGTYTFHSRVRTLEKNAMKILNAQPSDSSNYSCQIAPSTSRLHINLVVLSEPHIVISSHDRLYTNRSITYTQGTRVEFECKAVFTKNPYKIIWSMNGHRVKKEKVSNGKVLINEVHADDAGTYQCLADDDTDRPLHATITVNVQYPPKVSTHRHHVNAQEGENAELYCNYKADPIATVHWKKNGELIPFTDVNKYRIEEMHTDKSLSRTILFVQNVARQDLGEYECEIQNSLGISQKKIYLQYEPETPQFEKIVQNGRVISLEWLVRSRQPLVDAIVDYKINSTHQWMKQPITSSKKHDEHTGVWKLTHELELAPGIWHFKIRTQNSEGWSEFSSQYDLVVPEAITDNDNSRPNDIIYAADVTGQSPNSATQFTLVPFILSSCLLLSIRLVPFFRIL